MNETETCSSFARPAYLVLWTCLKDVRGTETMSKVGHHPGIAELHSASSVAYRKRGSGAKTWRWQAVWSKDMVCADDGLMPSATRRSRGGAVNETETCSSFARPAYLVLWTCLKDACGTETMSKVGHLPGIAELHSASSVAYRNRGSGAKTWRWQAVWSKDMVCADDGLMPSATRRSRGGAVNDADRW